MYDIRFESDRWIVTVERNGAFQGSLPEVMSYCQHYLEFETKELDVALDEMIKRKHDGAHFGIRKSFIYTFRTADKPLEIQGTIDGLH
jgi:hypothetical protein